VAVGSFGIVYAQAPKFQNVKVDDSAYPAVAVEFDLRNLTGVLLTSLESSQVTVEEPHEGGTISVSGELARAVPDSGVAYLVAIDTSGSMKSLLPEIQIALVGFVEQLAEADRVAIVTFNNDVSVVRHFTDDRSNLVTSINELASGGTTTELYFGVISGLDQFELDGLPKRKVAIVISDGKDEGTAYTLDSCIDRARAVDVNVLGLGITSGDSRALLNVRRLAEETGGLFVQFEQDQDWSAKLDLLRRHVESRWRFVWQTTLPGDGATHDVRLQVNLGSVSVSHDLSVDTPVVRDLEAERKKLIIAGAGGGLGLLALFLIIWVVLRGRKKRAAEAAAGLAEEKASQTAAQNALGEQLQEVTRKIESLDRESPQVPTPISESQAAGGGATSTSQEKLKRKTVFAGGPEAGQEGYRSASLVYLEGPLSGSRVPLVHGRVTLGREDDNGVVLDEDRVSRYHAAVTGEGGVFWIEDLESANGTFVNDTIRVAGRHGLSSGDTIRIGGIVFRFVGEA